jgi:MFS family permease
MSIHEQGQGPQLLRSLKNRNYFIFFTGQGIAAIGMWTQNIAMSWLVFRLTDSAWMLGMIAFLSQIPSFFLAPFAGVLVDRWIKRRVLVASQILGMIHAGTLTVLTFTGALEVWHLLLLSFTLGCVNAFDLPARHAITAELVDTKEEKTNAIALNSVSYNIARLLGPSLGGILIPLVGEGVCFLLNTTGYLMAVISLLLLKPRVTGGAVTETGFWQGFREGHQYTFGQLPLRLILQLLGTVALLAIPYTVLLPVYVVQELQAGANWLGFLMGAAGVGSLIGAIVIARRTSFQGLEKMIAIAAVLIGTGLIALSYSKMVYISLVIQFVIGLGMIFAIVGGSTLLQCMVDDSLRARVMSFYTMTIMGITPIGSLIAGSLAQTIGTANTMLIAGIACLIGTAYFVAHISAFRVQACPIYVNSGNLNSMDECRYR